MLRSLLAATLLALFVPLDLTAQNPREKKVREDKQKIENDGFWIYNDLAQARAQAKKENRPILAVLRCIPCEECVKLDDNLVDQDPVLRPLLEKFVRVRLVSTNGLDLKLFQFDFDQSFAIFLLNAEGTIYGRFGTRSHRSNWVGDVSVAGLAEALRGALDLHADYPKNKSLLAPKIGPAPLFPTPEKFPTLGKYGPKLNYAGNVVASCIHCHQIGDAQMDYYRSRRQPIPDEVLFPYPHPQLLGWTFDPKKRSTLSAVVPDSLAAKAGFLAGDLLESLSGQPLLSIADVQWVLHRMPSTGGKLVSQVRRGDKSLSLTLELPNGWRQAGDLSWRATSWGLRRMATGGLKLEPLEGKRPGGLPQEGMALRVEHVGQYGAHAAAKNAGFQKNDVLIAFDKQTNLLRETDVFVHGVQKRKPGDRVPVTLVRNGKKIDLLLPLQP
jgi:hypothetical protein